MVQIATSNMGAGEQRWTSAVAARPGIGPAAICLSALVPGTVAPCEAPLVALIAGHGLLRRLRHLGMGVFSAELPLRAASAVSPKKSNTPEQRRALRIHMFAASTNARRSAD